MDKEKLHDIQDKVHDSNFFHKMKASINVKSILIYVAWCFIVTVIVETLARYQANGTVTGGVFGGIRACIEQPLIVFYSMLVIMFTMSIALIFKRRYFVMTIISIIWIGFGVADFILLSYRVTPFTAIEFKLIDAALGVLTNYVSTFTTVVVFIMIAFAVAWLVFMFIKVPKIENASRGVGIIAVLLHGAALWIVTVLFLTFGVLSTNFPNLANAFLDYGFPYCFANSLFNTGIHKPADYSDEKVSEIVKGTKEPAQTEATETAAQTEEPTAEPTPTPEPNMTGPNIIFLQLESFFDLTAVEELELSEDPIPFFRELVNNYSSGYLSVPCIGAGTANTEFEIMTGMNLDFFGPGEYPYKTILETTTCESTAYNLKEIGYSTHAIHNNKASFYNRNTIFPKLGYDDFTSIELMNISEYTPNGWAKDAYLTRYILQCLQATENRDYVYAISVQGHGKYPTEQLIENPAISVISGVDEDRRYGVEYYANQIRKMDDFLRELVTALQNLGEDTILVAYGDHLPGLGFTNEDIVNGDMNQTQYFIWSNMNLEKQDEDLEAYQLSSRVLERIGVSNGVINAYHQKNKDVEEKEYLDNLKILGYDMLYGNQEVYRDRQKYVETDMKYGVTQVELTGVTQDPSDENYLLVKGKNFTQYTRVMVGDQKLDTEFVDEETVLALLEGFEDGEELEIVAEQNYKGKLLLQTSNAMSVTLSFGGATEEPLDGEDFTDKNENFGNLDDINKSKHEREPEQ